MAEMNRTCPYKKACGGCSLIGSEYGDTLHKKEEYVRRLLKPYVTLAGIVGMEHPYYYRNKVHRACGYEKKGRREFHLFGIYAEGTHRIIPVRDCLIEDAAAQKICETTAQLASAFRISFYDEDTCSGLLRHILVRTAHASGEVMVILVLSAPVMPGKNAFVRELVRRHPEISTVVINVNPRRTSMILGEKETTAYGKGYIEDTLCGRRFRISSRSFYQVNSVVTELLYNKAAELARLTGKERVLDAYCGIGTIGIIAADRAREVTGVESNRDAVRDARTNAKLNGMNHIRFYAEDAGEYLLRHPQEVDVLFMDPPRSGASPEFLRAVLAASPKRIVYVSCNPATLARDLKYLCAHGYGALEAWAYDQFCWTEHVECIVLMSRKNAE